MCLGRNSSSSSSGAIHSPRHSSTARLYGTAPETSQRVAAALGIDGPEGEVDEADAGIAQRLDAVRGVVGAAVADDDDLPVVVGLRLDRRDGSFDKRSDSVVGGDRHAHERLAVGEGRLVGIGLAQRSQPLAQTRDVIVVGGREAELTCLGSRTSAKVACEGGQQLLAGRRARCELVAQHLNTVQRAFSCRSWVSASPTTDVNGGQQLLT